MPGEEKGAAAVSLSTSDELLAGRYRLDGVLGTGGMAKVHRAWDTHLRRFVAIKLFRMNSDATSCRRFDNEIHTLARLSHPGLVCVYDAGTSEQVSFVALQLVDGDTLRDHIAGGPMPVADVRRLGAHLANALAYVHTHGVVHRDIKPSNILIDTEQVPYLADFGLARLTGTTRLTKSDQMVGTPAYLAPEQVRGGEVGCAADIYAFGLVLLECLTGRREYEGTEIEAAVARLHRPPDIPQELPADLVRLLSLMTSLTPRRRPSAFDCAQALRGQPDADDTVTALTPLPQRPRVPKKVLIASTIAALSITGITWTTMISPEPATSAPPPSTPPPVTHTTTPPPAPMTEQTTITHTSTVAVPVAVPVHDERRLDSPTSRKTPEQRKHDKPRSSGHGKKEAGTD
jgi:serine/threonine protein kinase